MRSNSPTPGVHTPWYAALGSSAVRPLAYLLLCAAYLQGGLVKLTDFPSAVNEMVHLGLQPAPLIAALVIALELGASLMILTGWLRWLGALMLGFFTLLAIFLALRFWQLPAGPEQFAMSNAFFEHLGLVGGFLLIAWLDVHEKLTQLPTAHASMEESYGTTTRKK